MAYVIIALMTIFVALFLMAFIYPELFARFGKFLFRPVLRAVKRKPGTRAQAAKPKKLTPNEVLAKQIEQLIPGQILRYKIVRETWGADFIAVELNPQYPQKGKKYILSTGNIVQGMPGGKKSIMYESDNSLEIATSVLDRKGEQFVMAGETPVGTEKVAVDAKKEAGSAKKVDNVW